jgi:hypothetical protein
MALFALPFLGALIVMLSRVERSAFGFLTAEDASLEWMQFAALAVALVFGVLMAGSLLRRGQRLAALAYLLFALGCFFIAGEEISWGQRILGLETPEGVAALNHQQEINVHNIPAAQTAGHVMQLAAGLYGSIGAWLIRRRHRGEIVNLLVPPLFLSAGFFVMFAYRAVRVTLFPAPDHTVVEFGEWPEFCFALALAAFALLGWRRLSQAQVYG